MTSTDVSVMKPAHGPSMADSNTPPTMCPLEPVPGIEKLIICAAKMKAPITPIKGTMFSWGLFLTFFAAMTKSVPETITAAPATTGEVKASAMCIFVQFKVIVYLLLQNKVWNNKFILL